MNRSAKLWFQSTSASLLLFALAAPAAAGPAPFTSTTLVGCTGNQFTDGANLQAAVAAATAPALIKLEPCVYDLSGQQLVMRNQVDVEGSGRDVTTIRSNMTASFSDSTVIAPAGIEAELRQLTVLNNASDTGTGITINTDRFLLTEVNVETENGLNSVGVLTNNSSSRINEVFVRVLSKADATGVRINGGGTVVTESFSLVASEGDENVAWDITNFARPVLDRAVALAFSGRTNIAVSVHNNARADLDNVRGTAFGGTDARGLYIWKEGFVDGKESTFTSTNDSLSLALSLEDGNAKITESTFVANSVFSVNLNTAAVRLSGSSSLDTNQSNYRGTVAAQNQGNGQARFGASQLVGSVATLTLNGLKCVFSYNGSYNARNNQCV